MITMYRIYMYLLAACLLLGVTACEEEGLGNEETPFAPYVLSLGINSNGTTTYYVVTAPELMSGTINAVAKVLSKTDIVIMNRPDKRCSVLADWD